MGGLIYTGSNQRIPEYNAWTALCVGLGCKSYVELGCGSAWEQLNAGILNIVTVDILPNGMSGIRHIQGNSHDHEVRAAVLLALGDDPDVVFIDADHSEAGVRADFEAWWKFAKLAVGFHDILMPGVMEFWEEVCLKFPSVQIIGRDIEHANRWQHGGYSPDGKVNCGGIGVLFKI